jgi:hypothetical protein
VEHIRSSRTRFNLSTSEIIRLTGGDVPAEVIEAMRNASRPAAAPPGAGANAVPAPAVPASAAPASAVPASAVPASAAQAPLAAAPAQTVTVFDGLPIAIRLAEDVPADAPAGKTLRFTVVRDFHVRGTVVVAEGAVVTGEIVEAGRKKPIGGNRVMFRLKDADMVGGGKLALRANPQRRGEDSRRITDVLGAAKRSKDLAQAAGAEYLAYVEGDQTVTVRK